jgi:hypothetical protein
MMPMSSRAFTAIVLLFSHLATAQPVPLLELPEDLAAIRASQTRLASEQDVGINFLDTAKRSASSLDGVPAEFRDEPIESEHDLLSLFDRLYPYFGFTGTETLELQSAYQVMEDMQYLFREYIDGIPTNQLFTIKVGIESKRLSDFNYWLYMDRNLSRQPEMSEAEAVERALCFADKLAEEFQGGWAVDADGAHEVSIVYETWGEEPVLIPVWHVSLVSADRNREYREGLAIMPGGIVRRDSTESHRDSRQAFSCADEEAVPDWVRE